MYRHIKQKELFEYGGRHFISENFMRMHTVELEAKHLQKGWTLTPFELFVIIIKGNGTLITPNQQYDFIASEQFYIVNTAIKFLPNTDLEIELVYLPGPYDLKTFAVQNARVVHFSKLELLGGNGRLLVEEIYGKVRILKLQNNSYNGILKEQEELLVICLEGVCEFSISNSSFTLYQGEQVYLKNERYNLKTNGSASLEFINAPTEAYVNLLKSQKK